MNSWNEGYFTESTYTYGYYQDINPIWQNFCVLANNFVTPPPFAVKVASIANLATVKAFQ